MVLIWTQVDSAQLELDPDGLTPLDLSRVNLVEPGLVSSLLDLSQTNSTRPIPGLTRLDLGSCQLNLTLVWVD